MPNILQKKSKLRCYLLVQKSAERCLVCKSMMCNNCFAKSISQNIKSCTTEFIQGNVQEGQTVVIELLM